LAKGGFGKVSVDFSSDEMCKHYLELYNEITHPIPLPDARF
jgi:hypothetical protein